MRRVLTGFLALLTLTAGTVAAAAAAPIAIHFTYTTDFASSFASDAVGGLAPGDPVHAHVTFDTSLLPASGDGDVTVVPASGSTFVLELGTRTFTEADDIFGGPVVEFLDHRPVGLLFEAGFTSGPDSFFIELGHGLTGDPEFRLSGALGSLEAAGGLTQVVVPGPAALLLVSGGIALLAVRRIRASA